MRQEGFTTHLFRPLFPLFLLLLVLDDSQELSLFNFCLFSKLMLSFLKLLRSGLIEVSQKSSSFLMLENFTLSGVSLLFFLSSLGPKSINFRLSIGSFLLKFSHLLEFFLFFFFNSLFKQLPLVLSLLLLMVISVNSFILFNFFLFSLLFKGKRHLIGLFDFKEHFSGLSLLFSHNL